MSQKRSFRTTPETAFAGLGCVMIILWLVSALISVAISAGLLAALVAGVYFLFTGEFLYQ